MKYQTWTTSGTYSVIIMFFSWLANTISITCFTWVSVITHLCQEGRIMQAKRKELNITAGHEKLLFIPTSFESKLSLTFLLTPSQNWFWIWKANCKSLSNTYDTRKRQWRCVKILGHNAWKSIYANKSLSLSPNSRITVYLHRLNWSSVVRVCT